MAENKQVPVWQDYAAQMPTPQPQAPYAAGAKTMRSKEMDSANRRHAAEMALGQQRLALQKWEAQMRFNLNLMEFEALKAARLEDQSLARDKFGFDRERWEWEKSQANQLGGFGWGSPNPIIGGANNIVSGNVITPKEQNQMYGQEMLNRIRAGKYAPGM